MLYRLVRTHLRPYAVPLGVLLALQLVATLASLYLPSLNGRIIDEGVAVGDTGFILSAGMGMLAVSFVQILATIAATRIGAQTAASLGRDVRSSVFRRVGDFSAQELSRFGAPTLISRSTNDVTQVQTVVYMGLAMMVSAPIMMVGGIVMALREDVGLSWLVAVAVPALAVAIGLVIRRMVPHFKAMQKSVDSVNRILREQITGVRVVRAFVREPVERERFGEANATYTATAVAVGRLMALAFPLVMVIFNASTVAVLWFGAVRVDDGTMQIGALTAFMAYLIQILMSVMMATFMAMMIPRATVSAGRIQEVLDTESSVTLSRQPERIPAGPVTVELRGVSFAYPGAESPVLREVSITCVPGTTTAIVGSTGAGKTTLVGLVPAAPRRHRADRSSSAASTCATPTPRTSGATSGSCRSGPTSSPGPSRATCATATPTPPTTSCGRRCGSPRGRTSCARCPTASRRRSPRAARTSAAGSASASPSRGPS